MTHALTSGLVRAACPLASRYAAPSYHFSAKSSCLGVDERISSKYPCAFMASAREHSAAAQPRTITFLKLTEQLERYAFRKGSIGTAFHSTTSFRACYNMSGARGSSHGVLSKESGRLEPRFRGSDTPRPQRSSRPQAPPCSDLLGDTTTVSAKSQCHRLLSPVRVGNVMRTPPSYITGLDTQDRYRTEPAGCPRIALVQVETRG